MGWFKKDIIILKLAYVILEQKCRITMQKKTHRLYHLILKLLFHDESSDLKALHFMNVNFVIDWVIEVINWREVLIKIINDKIIYLRIWQL